MKSNNRAYNSKQMIPRVHFLRTLLEEASNFLHHRPIASVLNVRVYKQPFCRDFGPESQDILNLMMMQKEMRIFGGCLLISPEHRLSFDLKCQELELIHLERF